MKVGLLTAGSLETLFGVVLTMVRILAPFTFFLTENMYQQLRKEAPTFKGRYSASVHYLMLPSARGGPHL